MNKKRFLTECLRHQGKRSVLPVLLMCDEFIAIFADTQWEFQVHQV
jgi:hypothetical protein